MDEITARFILIHSRENIGPAPHADRGGIVVTIEDHPIFCKPIHIRRFYLGIPITPHRQGVLIIRHQENNVGWDLLITGKRAN